MTESMPTFVFQMDICMIKQPLKSFKCINMNQRKQIRVKRFVPANKVS